MLWSFQDSAFKMVLVGYVANSGLQVQGKDFQNKILKSD